MSDRPVAAGKSSFDLIDREKAMAVMDVRPDCRVADLACGPGAFTAMGRKTSPRRPVRACA